MSNTFTVKIPKNLTLEDGVDRVRSGILKEGGKYKFTGTGGAFSVKGVEGSFVIKGRDVVITIEKKPFLVSHKYVENAIRDYFDKA